MGHAGLGGECIKTKTEKASPSVILWTTGVLHGGCTVLTVPRLPFPCKSDRNRKETASEVWRLHKCIETASYSRNLSHSWCLY